MGPNTSNNAAIEKSSSKTMLPGTALARRQRPVPACTSTTVVEVVAPHRARHVCHRPRTGPRRRESKPVGCPSCFLQNTARVHSVVFAAKKPHCTTAERASDFSSKNFEEVDRSGARSSGFMSSLSRRRHTFGMCQ